MTTKVQTKQQTEEPAETTAKPMCGIIMPIAAMADYEATHWVRVLQVLKDAVEMAGYEGRLVSEMEAVGVIQAKIVQNLYNHEIVICDVSGKNPNVMFELGMRLAFDKPTIIVQDDSNGYSFDIGTIKHIGYRRDQRFDDVEEFKRNVADAIKATVKEKKADPTFSPFLKHFGQFTPQKIDNQEVPINEYVLKKLSSIDSAIARLQSSLAVDLISKDGSTELKDLWGGKIGALTGDEMRFITRVMPIIQELRQKERKVTRERLRDAIRSAALSMPRTDYMSEERMTDLIEHVIEQVPHFTWQNNVKSM